MKDYELINNTKEEQYEIHVEKRIAKVVYNQRGDVIYLMHTEVPEELEGQGIGSILVEKVLEDIYARSLKMVPNCVFVQAYLKRHPQWQKLVASSHNR